MVLETVLIVKSVEFIFLFSWSISGHVVPWDPPLKCNDWKGLISATLGSNPWPLCIVVKNKSLLLIVYKKFIVPRHFMINSTNYRCVLFVTKVQELFTCSWSMSECINFLIIELFYSLKFNKVLSLSFSFVNFHTIFRGQTYTKTFYNSTVSIQMVY